MPRVSICIPTYNGSRFIAEALESALAQTLPDLEVLVVDDGSSDDTVQIAEAFAHRDTRIQVHRNAKNRGLPGNWDRCRELATGDWIKFLFHDDLLRSDCVEKMVEAGCRYSAQLVCCRRNLSFFPEVEKPARERFLAYAMEHGFSRYFPGKSYATAHKFSTRLALTPIANFVGEPTAVLLRKETLAQFGRFHTAMNQLVDFEYWARIGVHSGIAYVDEPLATFRIHSHSATESNRQKAMRKDRLDGIILLHDYLHAPAYSPVRRSIIGRMRLIKRYSDRVAELKSVGAAHDKADPAWSDAIAHYPYLANPSLSTRAIVLALNFSRSLTKSRQQADHGSQGLS